MNKAQTKKILIDLGVDQNKLKRQVWDLSGIKFSNMRIVGINLSGMNLLKADFSGANLCDVNLTGAIISPIQLVHTYNLDYAILDPGRFADAVAAGYGKNR